VADLDVIKRARAFCKPYRDWFINHDYIVLAASVLSCRSSSRSRSSRRARARLLLHRLGASTDAGGRQRRRTLNIEPSGGWPIGDPARQEHGLRSITGRTVNASNPRSPTR
jgi:hypothetical protein